MAMDLNCPADYSLSAKLEQIPGARHEQTNF
jgi:hypothetical protein